jgi:hypothetical protein
MAQSPAVEQLGLFGTDTLVAPEPPLPPLDPELAPHRLGEAHQLGLDSVGARKRSGAYYTPPDVVEHLLDMALEPLLERRASSIDELRTVRVLDPAAGSGNYLSAAGHRIRQRLESLGVAPREAAAIAFGECLAGIDIDSTAVSICARALSHASQGTVTEEHLLGQILCADALELFAQGDDLFTSGWRAFTQAVDAVDGFDVVIGNPPFLSQLATETARTDDYSALLRARFGSAVAGLTDTAALFLLLAVEATRPSSGVTCLIQPISVLSSRDATGVRSYLLAQAGMRSAWICEDLVFDASVRVCAPVFERGADPDAVLLLHNREFRSVGSVSTKSLHERTWSSLLATTKGVPDRELRSAGVVGDIAIATADFRDQYYGLRGCVVDMADADDAAFPPLVTSGLLDPAEVLWGHRRTKFDKVSYDFPRVDVAALSPSLQDWARSRLQPKLMLATQTKVLEVFVDAAGRLLPSVPVVTVTADIDNLWRLGALLSSPPVTLVAARRHLGAALATDALKLAASDVMALPLPADHGVWSAAAQQFRRACSAKSHEERADCLHASALLMCDAFGLQGDEELLAWWADRMLARRRSG